MNGNALVKILGTDLAFLLFLVYFLSIAQYSAGIIIPPLFYVQFYKKLIIVNIHLITDSAGPLAETTVPAIVGLFIGLTILLFLFCFMFKLFTQSRWARARAYADAGQPPPTITLEGKFFYTACTM